MSELREAKRAGRGLLWSLWLGFALFSCQGPQAVGTNTNWMKLCDEDAECGAELSCECGRCTLACAESSTCPEGSSCSPSSAALLQCGGVQTATCQPTCSRSDECESGRLCLLG